MLQPDLTCCCAEREQQNQPRATIGRRSLAALARQGAGPRAVAVVAANAVAAAADSTAGSALV
eukprot:scaffold225_cov388-Prasinococcus_capsulatus_cf.AAC.32